MDVDNKTLVLDLLDWIASRTRTYAEVMDAWRTSCPRLPVWEDAVDLGLVVCERRGGSEMVVRLTSAGRSLLESERPGWAEADALSLQAP